MKEKTKYSLIFALKLLFVILLVCMIWAVPNNAFVVILLLSLHLPALLIIVGALFVIALGELAPGGRKGKSFFIRHVRQPLILAAAICVTWIICLSIHKMEEKRQEEQYWADYRIETELINEFAEEADEIICYGNADYVNGVHSTRFTSNIILIDYDTMRIGFVFRGYLGDFEVIGLSEGAALPRVNIQRTQKLKEPGAELITIYEDEDHRALTKAIQITMANGTIYTAENLIDDNGRYIYLGL